MSSKSETGHAVNISNLKILIDRLTAFGTAYAPSNLAISIASLTVDYDAVKILQANYLAGFDGAKAPINNREILFSTLNDLVTSTFNYLQSTEANVELIKDVKGVADSIRGFNLNRRTLPDGTPDLDHISNSHRGFIQRAEHFEQLILIYQGEPLYDPTETEWKISTLEAYRDDLKNANEDLEEILAPVFKLRLLRDHKLYDDGTGILDKIKLVKKYVRGKFKFGTPETRSIITIKFTKPSKKRSHKKKKNNNPPPTP
jgi:hypothetical protein